MTSLTDWLSELEAKADAATPDCGDNSCRFAIKRGGMRTNGGCGCCAERSVVHWSRAEKYAVAVPPSAMKALIAKLRAAEHALRFYAEHSLPIVSFRGGEAGHGADDLRFVAREVLAALRKAPGE
jgi:hypothetical protein